MSNSNNNNNCTSSILINDEQTSKEFVYTVTRSYQAPDGHLKAKTFEYYGNEAQELIKQMKERELQQLQMKNLISDTNSSAETMLKRFDKHYDSYTNDTHLWLNADLRLLLDSSKNKIGAQQSSKKQIKQKLPFVKEALDEHNRLRRLHGAQELKLNRDLCSIAQKWAETIAGTCAFEHSNNKYLSQSLGENIAMRYTSTGEELTGKQMTDQWYEESSTYDFDQDFQTGKGHFAQIVWKSTLEVGFGRAKSKDGKWYAVANYFPAGNYVGQFRQNVLRKKST